MMNKLYNIHIIWPLGFMGCIFILSSIPMDGGPDNIAFLTDLNPGLQNLLHIPLYGILAFLWVRFFAKIGWPVGRAVVLTLVIAIGYGCLDEIHQSFVPGRYGGLLDILLNSFGAVLGAGMYKFHFQFPGHHT
ncbi:MAG: VanZ family protein [Desulfotignum sp.]